jgi:hypothetical protein
MTAILPCGRTLSKQLPLRSAVLTRLISTSNSRVSRPKSASSSLGNADNAGAGSLNRLHAIRKYATAAAKTPSKPKAHTGRTTTKRTTARSTTAKSAAKPKAKKAVPKKAKAKPKPKPKPKKKVKKGPSPLLARRALKQRAHLHTEPKQLPAVAWTVYVTQQSSKGEKIGSHIKSIATEYKRISPEEREVCQPHNYV